MPRSISDRDNDAETFAAFSWLANVETIDGGSRWQRKRKGERQNATSAKRRRREAGGDDPQAQVGRLSPLFAQSQPEDRPPPQSRDVQYARGGREARARRAVFQASLRLRTIRRIPSPNPAMQRPTGELIACAAR